MSDASGTWGCGAFWESKWFQLAWEGTRCGVGVNIATKELIPIVMAVAMWGKFWNGQVVNCRCDNMAVVAVINSRTSRDPDLMHQLRCLAFFEAKFSFSVIASHIAGAKNSLADDFYQGTVCRLSYRLWAISIQRGSTSLLRLWLTCCAMPNRIGHLKPGKGCSEIF